MSNTAHIDLNCKGIVSVVQTPFTEKGDLDIDSLQLLVNDVINAGVDGLLAPVVASEANFLSLTERKKIVTTIIQTAGSKVPVIIGASDDNAELSIKHIEWAVECGASACLVSVPTDLYRQPDLIIPFFRKVSQEVKLPMIVQDFEFNGPGLTLDMIRHLKHTIPSMVGIKVETVLAGLKYTAVREMFGKDFFIAGGWAVTQLIEAMDRGVDAMIPESSMIRVYKRIQQHYEQGDRGAATELFYRLLPVLAFTNQEVGNSILFFKHLLVHKGIFRSTRMRFPEPGWDRYSMRIVEELIELYLELEESDNES